MEHKCKTADGVRMEHKCKTADGVRIEVGLKVRDYDNKVATVVGPPVGWEMEDEVCWPRAAHGGHWWAVCHQDHAHAAECAYGAKRFDGSRLTTRGL